MRFSLFGREKSLHTSFRSAGIPLCIVCEYCRKNHDFQCILACGTRLATHSSAGSHPIRMRFSLFGREKMLHTSFRSAGIPLCFVCEYCRKNHDFQCILACGTLLATHSSAGSQPIRMRISLFGREKMLHTSFRAVGGLLCIVYEL